MSDDWEPVEPEISMSRLSVDADSIDELRAVVGKNISVDELAIDFAGESIVIESEGELTISLEEGDQ